MNVHLKDVHWKEMAEHAHPRHWSGFTWTVLAFVLACAIGTAWVGVKLYQVTDRTVLFNTR